MILVVSAEENEEYSLTQEGDLWLATNITLNYDAYIGSFLYVLGCIL